MREGANNRGRVDEAYQGTVAIDTESEPGAWAKAIPYLSIPPVDHEFSASEPGSGRSPHTGKQPGAGQPEAAALINQAAASACFEIPPVATEGMGMGVAQASPDASIPNHFLVRSHLARVEEDGGFPARSVLESGHNAGGYHG